MTSDYKSFVVSNTNSKPERDGCQALDLFKTVFMNEGETKHIDTSIHMRLRQEKAKLTQQFASIQELRCRLKDQKKTEIRARSDLIILKSDLKLAKQAHEMQQEKSVEKPLDKGSPSLEEVELRRRLQELLRMVRVLTTEKNQLVKQLHLFEAQYTLLDQMKHQSQLVTQIVIFEGREGVELMKQGNVLIQFNVAMLRALQQTQNEPEENTLDLVPFHTCVKIDSTGKILVLDPVEPDSKFVSNKQQLKLTQFRSMVYGSNAFGTFQPLVKLGIIPEWRCFSLIPHENSKRSPMHFAFCDDEHITEWLVGFQYAIRVCNSIETRDFKKQLISVGYTRGDFFWRKVMKKIDASAMRNHMSRCQYIVHVITSSQ